jgi:hypothetical protein
MLSKLAASAGSLLATPAAQAVTKTTTVKGALKDTGEGVSTHMIRQLLLRPLASALATAFFLAFVASTGSAQYTQTNLVSNTSLYSPVTMDPNLIDSWGLAALPDSPSWVSSQNTSTGRLYTPSGSIVSMLPSVAIPCVKVGLTVPCSPLPGLDEPNNLSDTTPPFGPAGIVANSFSKAFKLSDGSAAQFILSTQWANRRLEH